MKPPHPKFNETELMVKKHKLKPGDYLQPNNKTKSRWWLILDCQYDNPKGVITWREGRYRFITKGELAHKLLKGKLYHKPQ